MHRYLEIHVSLTVNVSQIIEILGYTSDKQCIALVPLSGKDSVAYMEHQGNISSMKRVHDLEFYYNFFF
jgi:hypothetical protein